MKRLNLLVLVMALAIFSNIIMAQENSGRPLVANMTGAAERPGPGDPDGTGTAFIRLNQGQNQICFELRVSNIATPTAAHIHIAPPTAPGPVVVGLAPPVPINGTNNAFSAGCINNVPTDLIKAIRQNPQNYYVNVHNSEFPAGAVRGQLFIPE
jgi:hypothetical protein